MRVIEVNTSGAMYNSPGANISPVNPLPVVVWALAGVLGAIELVFQVGQLGIIGGGAAVGWRIHAIESYAFFDQLWTAMVDRGSFPVQGMMRFVSYPFIHGSLMHAAFAVVIVLAIGKAVGEVVHPVAFLTLFFAGSIVGALVYAMLVTTSVPLFGAYPGAYALIGGFTYLLWVRLVSVGENGARAFTLVGVLLGIRLVFGVMFGGGYDWIAEAAGFVAGFSLSFIVTPGGWSRLLRRLRQR